MFLANINKFILNMKNIYYNSSQNLNNKLSKLNLFFERNNKNYQLLTSFGNTYKNSKWLNYSIKNIKIDMITLFVIFIFIIFIFISLNIYFLGKDDVSIYLTPWSLRGIILNIWYLLYMNLLTLQNQLLIIIYSLVYIIKLLINNFIDFHLNFFLKKLVKVNRKKTKKILFNKTITNNNIINSIKKLYKLNYIINYLNKKEIKYNNYYFKSMWLKDTKSIFYNDKFALKDINFFNNNKLQNNLIYLNNLNLTKHNYNYKYLLNYNIINIIKIFKQDRWFFKNNIIEDNLVNYSNKITNSKKLIGLNIFNSDFINTNLWYSTKNKNLKNNELYNYLNNFNKIFYINNLNIKNLNTNWLLKNNFKYFNFFENSKFWLNKKYLFTNNNQDNNYLFIFLHRQDLLNSNNKFNNLYFFNLYINYHNLSYNFHLKELFYINMNKSFLENKFINNKIGYLNNPIDLLKDLNLNFILNLTFSKKQYYYYNTYLDYNFKKDIFFKK